MSTAKSNSIIFLDGGMSRELIRLEAPFRQPEWSALSLIETPELVRQVHADFARAGADVITTNSYALVPFHINEVRFREQGKELASLAGQLAREAAEEVSRETGRTVLVAGSLPPIFGSYEPENFDARRAHEYLDILVSALEPWVDMWLGETLSLIQEAIAVKAATASSKKPLWVSFCPDDSNTDHLSSPRLRSGDRIADTARWACSNDVEALLYNCCRPEFLTAAITSASEALSMQDSKPPLLGAYANIFIPSTTGPAANSTLSAVDEDLHAAQYALHARVWLNKGACIIGGCCGVGASDIRYLAETLRSTSVA